MLDQNRPGMEGQEPQPGKLVLPAYPGEGQPAYPGEGQTTYVPNHARGQGQQARIAPEMLLRRSTGPTPTNPLDRLRSAWNRDPAYKVLIIATVVVILAGFVFAGLAANAFVQSGNLIGQSPNVPATPPAGVAPKGTVDVHPGFPTPGGGKGSGASSLPPAHGTQPTPPVPSPQPNGALNVQLAGIPGQVANGRTVPVFVTTSEPNVAVRLQVTYSVAPFVYVSGTQITDGNGNASLNWNVRVFTFGRHKRITAKVVVVALDQNGHQVVSHAVNVQIVTTQG